MIPETNSSPWLPANLSPDIGRSADEVRAAGDPGEQLATGESARREWLQVDRGELASSLRFAAKSLGMPARAPRPGLDPSILEPIMLAESMGLASRFVELPNRWWKRDHGILIALWLDGDRLRPVAMSRSRWGGYRAIAPGGDRAFPLRSSQARRIRTRALSLSAPLPDRGGSLIALGRFAMWPWRADAVRLMVILGLFGVLGLFVPSVNRLIVDLAVPDADLGLVAQFAILLIGVNVTQTAFYIVARFHYSRCMNGAMMRLQFATWHHLIHLPARFFRTSSSGDLVHRGLAVTTMGHQLGALAVNAAVAGALALIAAMLLVWLQPMLACVALAFGVIEAATTTSVSWLVHRKTVRLERLRASLLGTLVQFINGIGKLRVAGAEPRAGAHWWSSFRRHIALLDSRQAWLDVHRAVGSVIPSLSAVALYGAAFRYAGDGAESSLSLGALLAFFTAYGFFTHGMGSLGQLAIAVTQAVSLEQLTRPIWRTSVEVGGHRAEPGTLRGDIRLQDVSFQYHDSGPRVLDRVSLHVSPGEFVAIVGKSGSGKSSLVRLLLDFEQPTEGGVFYDDQDLRSVNSIAVRRQLGCVLQKSSVFAGTMFDNVAGGATIDMSEAWAACRDAELADDIRAFPMGMYALIAERGANLSGGQRQRLLIARALASRPRIVVLDEATSALSPDAQHRIMTRLAERRVTRVVVAHRIDAIRQADRIVVLDEGRIIESGTFEALIAARGLFAQYASHGERGGVSPGDY